MKSFFVSHFINEFERNFYMTVNKNLSNFQILKNGEQKELNENYLSVHHMTTK